MIGFDEAIELLKKYRGGNPYYSYNTEEYLKDVVWKFNLKDIREENNVKDY